ncbi:MAG: ArgE/DapE family deacylase [Candidatus Methylarchaceae archaeon HK01B]|nr:ArgE/DapE family deacylase [Candidatus Methylarchaceae archaeon HK02M1]MCP8318292.1 ArgE/DapE family deacylase [Candidatus Methylarchaceae archaeon HK01B]
MKKLTYLSDEVESLKGELLRLTSQLIRTRSENPPGDTSDVADVVEDHLKSIGLNTKRVEPIRKHVNVIAEMGSGDHGLILCGHIDTVPIGDIDRWSFNPFSGEVIEGRILGRGATDMKGGVAGILTAVEALTKFEAKLNRKITIALFCDEETGGHYGALWMVKNQLIKGREMIIGESSNYHKVGHVIIAGERGLLWSKLRFSGIPHHGSRPMLGKNAIMHAVKALSKLKSPILAKVNVPYEAMKLVKEGKKTLMESYRDKRHLKPHYAIDHYTLNVGVGKGGTKANIVADTFEVDLDLRIPIGGSRAEAERIIESIAGEGEINYINYAPPSFTPTGSYLVRVLRKVSRSVFREKTPAICIAATTDAHYLRSVLDIPVVSYGPGYEEKCHVYDEYVDIIDVLGCVKVYAQTALILSS